MMPSGTSDEPDLRRARTGPSADSAQYCCTYSFAGDTATPDTY